MSVMFCRPSNSLEPCFAWRFAGVDDLKGTRPMNNFWQIPARRTVYMKLLKRGVVNSVRQVRHIEFDHCISSDPKCVPPRKCLSCKACSTVQSDGKLCYEFRPGPPGATAASTTSSASGQLENGGLPRLLVPYYHSVQASCLPFVMRCMFLSVYICRYRDLNKKNIQRDLYTN
jgi:hypothetical protein